MIELVAIETLAPHLDALIEILRACVADGANVNFIQPFGSDEARRFWQEKVAAPLQAGKRILLLASVDGKAAGTVQLDLATPPNQAHRAEVMKLLVHPAYRRFGIARALMQQIEKRALSAGRWLLTLDTASDAAVALYESLGYERVGSIPAYSRVPDEERYPPATFLFKLLRPIDRTTGRLV